MLRSFTLVLCLFFSVFVFAQTDNTFIRGIVRDSVKAIELPRKTYAVVVGISKYPHLMPLNYADMDAELFRSFLLTKAGGSVKPENISLLTNDQATLGNVVKIINELKDNPKLKSGDRVYIFFAGHGDGIKNVGEYYLLLSDCDPAGDANNYQIGGAYDVSQLKKRVRAITKKGVEVFLILDACRSNDLPGGGHLYEKNESAAEEKEGDIMMLATGPGQVSMESRDFGGGHGLFTFKLIDGLSGQADKNKDGVVNFGELDRWVSSEVSDEAQRYHIAQDPVFCCSENKRLEMAHVDSAFMNKWALMKNEPLKDIADPKSHEHKTRGKGAYPDSLLYSLNTRFIHAIGNYKLLGKNSAEEFYDSMSIKFPFDEQTLAAKATYLSTIMNICQQKINLYLEGKDNTQDLTIVKRLLEEKADDEPSKGRKVDLRAALKTDFLTAATLMEKAAGSLTNDTSLIDNFRARAYFFHLKDYYHQPQNTDVMRREALNYSKLAWKADSIAAFVPQVIALYYEKNKQYDSAIAYLRKAITLAPKWPYPTNHLGYVFFLRKQYDSAGYYLLKAINQNPTYSETYFNYGMLMGEKGEGGAKNPFFGKPLNLPNSINQTIYSHYGNLMNQMRNIPATNWFYSMSKNYTGKGNNHQNVPFVLLNGNYDKAKQTLKENIRQNIRTEECLLNLGKIYIHEKKWQNALHCFEKLLAINPLNPQALYNMGYLYSITKRETIAIPYFQKALTIKPIVFANYLTLGNCYATLGNYGKALEYFYKGFGYDSLKASFLAELANAHYNLGNKDSALWYVNAGLDFIDQAGESFYSMDDQVFDKALFHRNALGYLYNTRALLYYDANQYDSSLCFGKKALAAVTTSPFIYNIVADSYFGLGKLDSAISYYNSSIVLDPTSWKPYYNLACIYSKQHKEAKALFFLKTAHTKGASKKQIMEDDDLQDLRKTKSFEAWKRTLGD